MEKIYSATIEVVINKEIFTKKITDTEEKIYEEAHEWMYLKCLQYMNDHGIKDLESKVELLCGATHAIRWDKLVGVKNFVVYEDGEIYAIYPSLEGAEEAIFTECENWATEMIMTASSKEVMGKDKWDVPADYAFLMRDCADIFFIEEVMCFRR